MYQFLIKTLISAVIIAIVSTVSKRVPLVGAIIISLPLTSILALIWLYSDTKDVHKIIGFSNGICLMIIPSILFFVALSIFLKNNFKFHYAMIIASIIMIISYAIYTVILKKFGIKV